jgi:hypothetical protein
MHLSRLTFFRSSFAITAAGITATLLSGWGVAGIEAADPTLYVSPAGTDNPTCNPIPCQHVKYAVGVAAPGDTVKISAGTYVEQVLVDKNLTLSGAGVDVTIIKGPDVKAFDVYNKTYILELTNGATVTVDNLTVTGPSGPGGGLDCGPNPLSLDMGIAAINNATLNLNSAAVRNIYDIDTSGNENSGCQRGDAISIGKPGGVNPTLAVPAHGNIDGVLVSIFQKDGIAVRTAGSTLNAIDNRVVNTPSNVIASNGIEVVDGPVANIQRNEVSGNQCNLMPGVICGPSDPIKLTQASGILSFGAAPSTVIANNQVFANDMGIYTDDGIRVMNNQDSNNRAVGLYVDTDATNLRAFGNTTNDDGVYGIAIGPAFPVSIGGTGKPNPGGNFFINDTAFGNSTYDMWQSSDAGPNTNEDNHCNTAFPSTTYWDCEPGEQAGDNDNDNDNDDHEVGGDGQGHEDNHDVKHPVDRRD